jgi:hypothetical protein
VVGLGGQSGGFGTLGALFQGIEAGAVGKICHYEGPPHFSLPLFFIFMTGRL